MLKLTRRSGESVRIGNAVVTIDGTGARVRLSIDAPPEVLILRTELEPRVTLDPIAATLADDYAQHRPAGFSCFT
tara:strand:+ start:4370 stop:4594 length:225 start_codon:yes stop_codon:yes gene_type:complete